MRDFIVNKTKDAVSHYDIYVYKDWTLREVQDTMTDAEWNNETMKWKRKEGALKTTIVWGIHQPCGMSGLIQIVTGKASCMKCKQTMPTEVFENLRDAIEMLKMSLEEPAINHHF